jgi:ethanolamine utilization protein EutQ
MGDISRQDLEKMVRRILVEILAEGGADDRIKQVDEKSGVRAYHLPAVKPEPFDTGKAGDRVFLKDLATLEESPRLGFGVMEMDRSTFKWTLNYDEVDYIIDGVLEILIDGRKVVGRAGDVIFIPARTTIEFSAPAFTRFFYVVYPANWYDQSSPEPGPPPAASGPEPFVGPDGGLLEEKPEDLTHLKGRQLVRKDHPVIVWRGRLDAFCARLIQAQLLGQREGRPDLAEELEEILDFCRRLLKAELKGLAVEDFRLLGLTPSDLRERSHHPARFFGHPHILMSHKMGPLPVALNALRAEVRAVEVAAAAAFGTSGSSSRRDDIILALNRLSSLFYIMVFRYLPKDYRSEGAGI